MSSKKSKITSSKKPSKAKMVENELKESCKDKLFEYADSLTEDFFSDLMGIKLKLPLMSPDKLYDRVCGIKRNFNEVFNTRKVDDVLDNIYDINYKSYYELYPSLLAFEEVIGHIKGVYDFNEEIDPDDSYFRTNFKYWSLLVKKLRELIIDQYDFSTYLIPGLSDIIKEYLEPKIELFFPIKTFYKSKQCKYGVIEYEEREYLCDNNLSTIYAERVDSEYVEAEKAVLGMKIENKTQLEIIEAIGDLESEDESEGGDRNEDEGGDKNLE